MEVRKEAKTIHVDYECPKCKKGYLRPMGNVLTTNPLIYPHKCNNPKCSYREDFKHTYPYIDYEYMNDNVQE